MPILAGKAGIEPTSVDLESTSLTFDVFPNVDKVEGLKPSLGLSMPRRLLSCALYYTIP